MKKVWLMAVLALVLLVASACSGGGSSSSEEGGAGEVANELTYAATTDAVGLSPILTNDSVSSSVNEQIYETLFNRNPDTMEMEPNLVESYEQPDDLTWTFTLKEGIEFQDGTPFNAEAVKYTFDKFRDPATAAPRASLLEPIEEIIVDDEYVVTIKTKYPFGGLLAALGHSNAAIVSPEADQNQDLMQNPVGTGPFKFVSWEQGNEIVLEANENYWRGAPKLEKVTFKVVPEYSTAISMMSSGEVQFIDAVPPEQLTRLEGMDSVDILTKDGTPMYYLGFNMTREPMNNLEFRKAVAYAIDREAYVNQLNGLGYGGNAILGPQLFGYDESAEEAGYEYDPEMAKQIVEENGFGDQELEILTPNRETQMKIAEIVQANLSEAGIPTKITQMEWGTYLETARLGEYDITTLSWSNVTGDGSELFYPNFHSDNIGSSNRTAYNNPEFDELIRQSRETVDQDKRIEILTEANKLITNDAPAILMHHGVIAAAVDKSVKGLELEPTGQWSLYNVTRE
ncbi:glutathione ABC transporter substrate-binding protein [Bacillus fonticola]|uniref:glutathione ABC transporter substrate-binding protein n=1 Tax=Bacillus fonticola TaxID=2728853 RepID=UPI00147438D9|nr:glutathione ABC transporter substrate-binding protein [Bacillus fonticola]